MLANQNITTRREGYLPGLDGWTAPHFTDDSTMTDAEGRFEMTGVTPARMWLNAMVFPHGFDVPIDHFAEHWSRLAAKEVWGLMVTTRPWIGVEHDAAFREAHIQQVRVNSPAERAGLQPGDIIVAVNDETIADSSDLRNQIGLQPVGSQITLVIIREGRHRTVKATIRQLSR